MARVRLVLFGTPRIEYEGTAVRIERRKAMALVAYLALANQPQSREALATLLWPELDDEHARSALRSTLHALTKPISLEWIEADRSTLALKPDSTRVDVGEFTGLLQRSALHDHDPEIACEHCVSLYEKASETYQEDFLAGFHLAGSAEFDDWQTLQSEWLRRELAGVLRRLAHYEAENGRLEAAIDYTLRWLSLDDLHEPAHRLLMQLYATNGQRSEAVRQYQQCVQRLDQELASPPEEATTRLYEAILDNRLATSGPVGASSSTAVSVLPPLPALIVGREQAMQGIRQRLGVAGEVRPTTVIQGWPGVGKSTIAAQIAHDQAIAGQFPDGVLWASLGERPDISGEISAWADALGLREPGGSRKVEESSAQITAALRDKRMLLIVDDVWQAEHAQPFRVGGKSCALVLTSRLNNVAADLAPTSEDIYRLPVLSEDAGLELLGKLAPESIAQYPDETRQLVGDLEGLPLAIHVAGRLLQSESRLGWGVGELLLELREGAALLSAQPPSDMIGAGRDTSPTVATLLKRSTDELDPELRGRFALLGLFVPKPATFDLDAMAAAWGAADPRPSTRKLVDRGLLEPVGSGRFQMHALLVLHARSLLESEFGSLA